MKALIIYDSVFGNTEEIARAIAKGLEPHFEVDVMHVDNVSLEKLSDLKLLIIGSPTRQFKPTKTISSLLKKIPRNGLKDVKAAVFDTRISIEDIDSCFLNFMIKLFGYAAKPIADRLMRNGADLVVPPEGFFVQDTEGPLKEGELKRAEGWASQIITQQFENLKSKN